MSHSTERNHLAGVASKCLIGNLQLTSGQLLREVEVAYVCYGTLAPDGGNAVLVTHGLTSGHGMLSSGGTTAEGSWAALLQPGAPLDAREYFVVCSNVLGSSFGSTGPGTAAPSGGSPLGADFPALSLQDMVNAQRRLLAALGVQRLRAVVGPSYGGMQALQWALDYPDFVGSIGVIASGLHWPQHMGSGELRAALEADPDWCGGRYEPGGGMTRCMAHIRRETLLKYGFAALFRDRAPDPSQLEAALDQAAWRWAQQFDANSLLVLQGAGERFDVREHMTRIQCPVLFVLASTDQLFPPGPEVEALLPRFGGPVTYRVLETPYGHLASGVEWRKWEDDFRALLLAAGHGSLSTKATV